MAEEVAVLKNIMIPPPPPLGVCCHDRVELPPASEESEGGDVTFAGMFKNVANVVKDLVQVQRVSIDEADDFNFKRTDVCVAPVPEALCTGDMGPFSETGDFAGLTNRFFVAGNDCSVCEPPTGGCCLPGAALECAVLEEEECAAKGGTYQGDETDCSISCAVSGIVVAPVATLIGEDDSPITFLNIAANPLVGGVYAQVSPGEVLEVTPGQASTEPRVVNNEALTIFDAARKRQALFSQGDIDFADGCVFRTGLSDDAFIGEVNTFTGEQTLHGPIGAAGSNAGIEVVGKFAYSTTGEDVFPATIRRTDLVNNSTLDVFSFGVNDTRTMTSIEFDANTCSFFVAVSVDGEMDDIEFFRVTLSPAAAESVGIVENTLGNFAVHPAGVALYTHDSVSNTIVRVDVATQVQTLFATGVNAPLGGFVDLEFGAASSASGQALFAFDSAVGGTDRKSVV